jgi:cell division protein FtsI (penicillin-binding protein 3)/stage V sporulation protein D (sporulation-specific penicillin-binding protein)
MQHRNRAIWIMFALACGFTLISFNLIQVQLVQHDKFTRMAIKNHMDVVTLPAKRGALLDADGNVLAQTQRVYDIRLDGLAFSKKQPEAAVKLLADALQVPPDRIVWNVRDRYQLLAHNVEDAVMENVKALKLDSVIIEPRDRRVYPNNYLAAHILGFTDDNGRGLAGMEKQMDAVLRGVPGERLVERDAHKNEIALYDTRDTPAVDGDDVTLTIKTEIQHVVDEQLDQIVQTYSPEAAYIIVMNPHTGEVLAMGSRPTYDPNDRASFTPEKVRNRCITDPVEPGSVFKIITLGGALNEGKIALDTPVFCENGCFLYAGRELHDDDEHHGWLSAEEVLSQSSNIGFAKIAINDLGPEKLYSYAAAFGMGERTGLFTEQGETPGLLRPVSKWSGISISRVPMGQEVLASPIQLAAAMSVIANGGQLMAPMLAKQISDPTGRPVKTFEPHVVRQVISAAAAREVAQALHQVTIDGTAKAIKITEADGRGFSFAGKTGTAQKWINGVGYSHTQHVSSFIGFMPVEDPAFVALVMVDDPKTQPHGDYGAQVSAPVFANIARQMAQFMNIQPDIPAPMPPVPVGGVPVLSSNTPVHASL